ncbi:MAG: TIGR03016 family PEP-CTERM system-associated outer membrane protein [Syntrophotaleaceae bacterium]
MKRILAIIVLLGALLPLPVRAAFELEPRLLIREEFTDNLFLDTEDEESDFITTIAPGILLNYDARKLNLELDYSLRFLKYLHNDEEDETSLSDVQRVRFLGELFPDQDFSLTLIDEYDRVIIDTRRQVDEDNLIVNRSNRNLLVVNPEYRSGYFNTFTPVAGYRFEMVDYDDPEGDDSDRHEFYVELEKRFSPRLTTALGYRYNIYRTDEEAEEDDYDRQDLTTRLSYQIGSSVTLHGSAGSAWLDYEERGSERALVWQVGLDWQRGSRWRTAVAYSEDFAVSVNDGLSKNRRAEASFNYLERIPWEVGIFAEKQDFRTEDREDRGAGINGRVTVPFRGRLSLDLTGESSVWRFLPEDEDVFRYSAGLALSYTIKYGVISVGYRYREENSDFDQNDYQSNLAYVQFLLTF